jgi:hypothetical protein
MRRESFELLAEGKSCVFKLDEAGAISFSSKLASFGTLSTTLVHPPESERGFNGKGQTWIAALSYSVPFSLRH